MSNKIYRLYIDEIGKSSYPKTDNNLSFDEQYFGLSGIILNQEESGKLTDKFRELKMLVVEDVDDLHKVNLHRRDILHKNGVFKILLDKEKEKEFNGKYLSIITEINFKIIFVGLDKISHKKRYTTPLHPYHYMMNIITERYVGLLEELKGRGDIMAESINKNEDEILQKTFEDFVTFGSAYCSINRIKDRISSKNIKFKEKVAGVSGLELSDLLAVPVLFDILNAKEIRSLIEGTFNCKVIECINGKYYKYGKKLIQ